MNPSLSPISSLGKKYLMAISGFILAGFVLVHMGGNLMIFLGQDALNAYAYKLQSIPAVLWGFRFILLTSTLVHVFTGHLSRPRESSRPP